MNGHVMFTSGHEWGYWMTDYLTAKMLWDPGTTSDALFADYASSYGTCAGGVGSAALLQFTALQTKVCLFDDRLAPYVMGEDSTVDLGYLADIYTIPRRVQFEDVAAMSAGDRRGVRGERRRARSRRWGGRSSRSRTRWRPAARAPTPSSRHGATSSGTGSRSSACASSTPPLSTAATLAYAAGGTASRADLLQPGDLDPSPRRPAATQSVARREAQYRFDVATLTGHYTNPTIYPYGYLRQAHTQCFFHRREDQVQALLQTGAAAAIVGLQTCDN